MKCGICNEEMDSKRQLTAHINKHHEISIKEYYDIYIDKGERYCPVCGEENVFQGLGHGYKKFCSKECKNSIKGKEHTSKLRKQSILKKHGVDNVMKIKSIKDKSRNTFKKEYGVGTEKHDEVISKTKETKLEKYGNENYNNIEQMKETKLEKYGNEYYTNRDKSIDTTIERHGSIGFANEEIKNKINKKINQIYGVGNFSQSKEFKEKFDLTRKNNYWNTYKKLLENKKIEILFDKEYYINNNKDFNFKCSKCGEEFIIDDYKHPQKIYCEKCVCLISNEETEVREFLDDNNINYITNKRFNVNSEKYKTFEADIIIEDKKLIIEYDGVYWHSDCHKNKDYHIDKTEYFNSIGYDVIHIFSTEWNDKQDIVKSIINNKLNINSKIYARKCVLKEINNNDYNLFLDDNHIQGSINTKIKLGLYFKDELVSVIGIGKSRFTKEYELYRFVNKKNLTVIGGFSKLIKNFFKLYKIDSIETYCDRRYFNGKGYKAVGFNVINNTKPSYFYLDKSYKVLYNRMNFMKHKLEDKLKIFDKDKSEYENMLDNGFVKIYDCGNIKLEIKKEDL